MMASPAQLNLAAQQEVNQLNAQISALRDRGNALAREACKIHLSIRALQVRVAHITNQNAPISRLPSDILAIIFEEMRRVVPSSTRFQRVPVEVQLSHVSSRWREVTLSTPSLWSSIRYPILHRENAMETYLQRCGECPLDVHIGPRIIDQKPLHVVTTTLLPRIAQFRELTIDTTGCEELRALLCLFRDATAPALKRLKVTCTDAIRAHELSRIEIFKGGTPVLSDVRLDGIPITLPASDATTLHIAPDPGSSAALPKAAFFDIISSFSSLTTLHLNGFIRGRGNSSDPITAPVELLALRELKIDGNIFRTGFRLFESISTPNIEIFSLVGVKQQELASIHKFIANSSPEHFQRLRSLEYLDCDFENDLDIYLPHATPALREISLSVDLRMPLLRLLLNSDKQAVLFDTPALWSNLQVIKLQGRMPWGQESDDEGSGDEDDSASLIPTLLLGIVSHRRRLGKPLATVHFEGRFTGELHGRFQEMLRKEQLYVNTEFRLAHDPPSDWAQLADYYGYQYRRSLFERLQARGLGQSAGLVYNNVPVPMYHI
ncbi:hypothetical protein BV22DRAFT_1059259 [Leucogyrophana mollusca]|uniref:Uncharacterized protein n=1 Tax=Leucogyrophana mollusca TaxID=85980 RepID=A0ACB8BS65_9AGAM|nr:hypothetical protein BV22DRAFT_1059259 [Leucogyrophana mollusca]